MIKEICILSIRAGNSTPEAKDWMWVLVKMYIKYFELVDIDATIVRPGNLITDIKVEGTNIYNILKSEIGLHKLTRISPFDIEKRRHTSFVSVNVYLEGTELPIFEAEPARSYVMHPYGMVKDYKSGKEVSDVDSVLNGNLHEFIIIK